MNAPNHFLHAWLNQDDHVHCYQLGSNGSQVSFHHYEQGSCSQIPHNRQTLKGLVIQGSLQLVVGAQSRQLSKGDWFEVPEGKPHMIECLTDCALMEFRFRT